LRSTRKARTLLGFFHWFSSSTQGTCAPTRAGATCRPSSPGGTREENGLLSKLAVTAPLLASVLSRPRPGLFFSPGKRTPGVVQPGVAWFNGADVLELVYVLTMVYQCRMRTAHQCHSWRWSRRLALGVLLSTWSGPSRSSGYTVDGRMRCVP